MCQSTGSQGKWLRRAWSKKGRGSQSADERGRRKDLYWLSGLGTLAALVNGAKPELLWQKEEYLLDEEKETFEFFRSIYDSLGYELFMKFIKLLWSSVVDKNNLAEALNDLLVMVLTSRDLDSEERNRVRKWLIGLHPENRKVVLEIKKQIDEIVLAMEERSE